MWFHSCGVLKKQKWKNKIKCTMSSLSIHQLIYGQLPCGSAEVYIYPLPLEPPFHRHNQPTPLGHHRALTWAPCMYVCVCVCVYVTSHKLSILHMIVYIGQSYLLSSSHLLLPLLCRQVLSLYLRLFYCLANRFISTIFLDSIYVSIYDIYFSNLLHAVWQTLGSSTSTLSNRYTPTLKK